MNDNFLEYVEHRLIQWAEWAHNGDWYGIGYQSCSIEYRLMTEGAIVRNQYANRSIDCNEEAEEMEMLVKELTHHNQKMALVLRCHYFLRGGYRTKSKMLDISHMQFKYYLDMAHQWLAGRLSSKKKLKARYACNVNTNLV